MLEDDFIAIDVIQSGNNYIVKDKNKITISEIERVEFSPPNRSCTFRLSFYIKENICDYITYIVKNFIDMLFNSGNFFKINLLIKEDLDTQPFADLSFHIEGIITNNRLTDHGYDSELLLGMDYELYKKLKNITTLMLNGKNIYLKLLLVKDADEVLNYYKKNREHLREFQEAKDEDFYTLENQTIFIRQQYIQCLNGKVVFFGIFKDKKIIGTIQLYNIMRGMFQDATVGYSIDKDEEGKGYMKEALSIISNYAFKVLKLHRLQAATLVDNIRSKAVLKACGFKEMGTSEKYLFINGKWQDQCIFYKINTLCDI